jgi:pimeloyl-ACP methyl ester carboxylesterase
MNPTPIEATFQATGARIVYIEWGKPGDRVVFLIHATGFHARCWDQTVKALGPGYRVIAVDTRGHGRSEKTGPINDWAVPAQDIAELIEHLNLKDAIGAGHSMGGHLLVQVAATHPRAFKRLVLIDPVMLPPEVYANPSLSALPEGAVHPVARRRNAWASWREMFDAFKTRHPYSLWRTEVLEDYCRYGLVPAANGQGLELACPPVIEASIYMGHAGRDIYALAARVQIPVTVLRAKPRDPGPRDFTDFAASPTWEGVARTFAKGRDVPLPHLTHFIPMQEPQLTARFIADGNTSA